MTFTVRWSDGEVRDFHSPSLVVHDHLDHGEHYTVADFTQRAHTALTIASDRVRAKFGFACSTAAHTSDQIHALAASSDPDGLVEVLAMNPPLPQEDS